MDGTGEITFFTPDGETKRINPEEELKKRADGAQLEEVNVGSALLCQLNSITEVLKGKKRPLPTIQDAYDSLKISFAMIDSTRSGKAVEL